MPLDDRVHAASIPFGVAVSEGGDFQLL